eukprot:4039655-Karenia_brevis.AAC.1
MNDGDIPWVETAEEDAWGRRIRCIRSLVQLTTRPEDVDPANLVFLLDPTLKEFLQTSVAACIWWKYVIIPWKRKYTTLECCDFIENPGDQVMEDTKWLQMRMSRRIRSPETLGGDKPSCPASSSLSRDIITQAHHILAEKFPKKKFFNELDLARVLSTP